MEGPLSLLGQRNLDIGFEMLLGPSQRRQQIISLRSFGISVNGANPVCYGKCWKFTVVHREVSSVYLYHVK